MFDKLTVFFASEWGMSLQKRDTVGMNVLGTFFEGAHLQCISPGIHFLPPVQFDKTSNPPLAPGDIFFLLNCN